jgi:cysteinyl-tRNA synthetase
MNFTFEALTAAKNALNKLRKDVANYSESSTPIKEYEEQFLQAVNDDLNMPRALSILWEVVRSNKSDSEKAATVFKFDKVLGLSLKEAKMLIKKEAEVPVQVQKLFEERKVLRKEKKYAEADKIREKIIEMGFKVEDKG